METYSTDTCSQNVKMTIPDTRLGRDGLVTPYNTYQLTVPPPLPASPPPSSPPSTSSAPSSPSPSPLPPPPPPNKLTTLKSILKPTVTRQGDATCVGKSKPAPQSSIAGHATTTPHPQPLPITISSESYVVLSPPPRQLLFIPIGRTINHGGRHFPLTEEFLATLICIAQSVPRNCAKNIKNGIYLLGPHSHYQMGPPLPLRDKDEIIRSKVGRDPILVDIPSKMREVDERINEAEKAVTIAGDGNIKVALYGKMHVVPVIVLSRMDLGYSPISRKGYLEGLGVRGQKRKWDDSLDDLGELEMVRDDKEGNRERKRKRVRYLAERIDENQTPIEMEERRNPDLAEQTIKEEVKEAVKKEEEKKDPSHHKKKRRPVRPF